MVRRDEPRAWPIAPQTLPSAGPCARADRVLPRTPCLSFISSVYPWIILNWGKTAFFAIVTPTDSFVMVQLPCRPLYLTHKTVRPTLTRCLFVRHERNSDLSSSQIQGNNGKILSFWGNCCPRWFPVSGTWRCPSSLCRGDQRCLQWCDWVLAPAQELWDGLTCSQRAFNCRCLRSKDSSAARHEHFNCNHHFWWTFSNMSKKAVFCNEGCCGRAAPKSICCVAKAGLEITSWHIMFCEKLFSPAKNHKVKGRSVCS